MVWSTRRRTKLYNDNGNKRKISKRKDPEASADYYKELGIPTEAVKEYLLNIANSNFEIWRKQNPDKSIYDFDFQINKMSVSGALFDMIKLLFFYWMHITFKPKIIVWYQTI